MVGDVLDGLHLEAAARLDDRRVAGVGRAGSDETKDDQERQSGSAFHGRNPGARLRNGPSVFSSIHRCDKRVSMP